MANELIQPDKFFLSRFGMTESALEGRWGPRWSARPTMPISTSSTGAPKGSALEESIVNRTSKSLSHGVGVRVCAEDRTGYAYSDEVTVDRMRLRPKPPARSRIAAATRPGRCRSAARSAPRALRAREHAARDAAGRARKATQEIDQGRARVRSARQEA